MSGGEEDCTETRLIVEFLEHMLPTEDLRHSAFLISRHYATVVWWALTSYLRIAPGQRDQRDQSRLTDGDYADAWHQIQREHHLLPGHFFQFDVNTERNESVQKTIGAFYAEKHRANVDGCPDWMRIGLPVEFQCSGSDPNTDNDDGTEVPKHALSYVESIVNSQHRIAVYMLFVDGPLFRIMRWDQSSTIMTEAVDYVHSIEGMRCLLIFLHCYSQVGCVGQGIDTSAIPLSEGSCGWRRMDMVAAGCSEDLDHLEHVIQDISEPPPAFVNHFSDTAVNHSNGGVRVLPQDPTTICGNPSTCNCQYLAVTPEFTHARQYFRDSLLNRQPRYMIKVRDRILLVGRNVIKTSSLIGRSTRGFVALDWQSQRLVFLKDVWRARREGIKQEGDILEDLNKAGVPNVPTVLAHGDVDRQESPAWGKRHASLILAWPMQNDLEARVIVNRRSSERVKKLPTTIATSYVDYWKFDPNAAQASFVTLSGPAGYPTDHLYAPWQNCEDGDAEYLSESSSSFEDTLTTVGYESVSSLQTRAGTKRPAEEMEECGHEQDNPILHPLFHHRVVLRDIYLESTAFESGYQWVGIILDCLRAHTRAYDQCGYMHRDVSIGNVLIRPIAVQDALGTHVYWRGILADWELAKHKSVDDALEPEKVGTWQFMSRNILSKFGDPVGIADELESFVHVLVYGCVRFIKHNFNSITGFMWSYFDGFSVNDLREAICPPTKSTCLTWGELTDGDHLLKFIADDDSMDHPLNDLIGQLLTLFKVRYEVLSWNREQQRKEVYKRRKIAIPCDPTPTETGQVLPRRLHPEFRRPKPAAPSSGIGTNVPQPPQYQQLVDSGPTQSMLRTAASLQEHNTIDQLLTRFLEGHSGMKKPVVWPQYDKSPDRLVDYAPARLAAGMQELLMQPC